MSRWRAGRGGAALVAFSDAQRDGGCRRQGRGLDALRKDPVSAAFGFWRLG
ncbi:hypothetical protein [Streptomyces sp. NPDC048650]|uniref:hypothetical protein n=1 Tax=Streptomyces sp. NPDC048650 TaxID=3365583 RepID=UPI0037181AEA